ncbi:phage major capsid protein [Ruminococcus sp. AF12-5]|nr:phage major capsid protein [Ruminococcus sp. AF12-5]
MAKSYDCSGWATKANMLCSDGRTIRKNAFEECDGKTVPVVWNHEHNDPNAVLGHAVLENRDNGVYAYISFNNTEAGQNAKTLVQHKDIDRLSIWANKLKQMGGDVIHGVIREVSLVLAGANPGAVIDSVMAHGDGSEEEAIIRCGEYIDFDDELTHSDEGKKGETEVGTDNKEQKPAAKNDDDKTVADVFNTLTEEQKTVVYAMIGQALEEAGVDTDDEDKKEVKHAASDDSTDSDETVADVFNTLTDKQKTVVYTMIGQALEDAGVDTDDVEHSEEGETDFMKHNVFDKETNTQDQEILTHSEFQEIIGEARRRGSLKDAFLEHGITDIDTLFPDAQTIDKTPGFIQRDNGWVAGVMAAVHKTPFSRVKSIFADITEDEARAKGYIKGKQKKDEVFKMLKRVTTPVTVYKKQSLDRDDMLDITDFDMIPWLKQEMRMMLDEELARAYLFGDGRSTSAEDKINEQNIRPVWTDDDVYTVKSEIAITKATTAEEKAQAFIKACIKSRKAYKGSGNPTMYMSEDMLTDCLLLEDKTGRVIYDTVEKLATRLRVNKIVPVPVMEGLSRIKGANTHFLAGLYVNLTDYNVGTDRGGDVTMFDDFDIDFNKQKYLIETRCSGAMCKPYGAVAIEFVQATTDIAA